MSCLLQAFYYGNIDVKCVPGGLRTHSGIIYPQSGQHAHRFASV